MSWITKADAISASGIPSIDNFATAFQFAQWAIENHLCVTLSSDSKENSLFNRNGISLKQKASVTSYEIRGLEKSFAIELAGYLNHDDFEEWNYYAIDKNGEVQIVQAIEAAPQSTKRTVYYKIVGSSAWKSVSQQIVPTEGQTPSQNIANATRANEADGWRVSIERTVWAKIPFTNTAGRAGGDYFIPCPPTEATNGVVVSQSKTKTFVATDVGTPVYQNETVVQREFRYLSAEAAAAKVASEASSNSMTYDVRVIVSWGSGGTSYKNIQVRGGGNLGRTAATDKTATCRYVGDAQLWTVTVTETTYQVTTS